MGNTGGVPADALQHLDNEQWETISQLLSPAAASVDLALDEVHASAQKLQQHAASKIWRWAYRVRGHPVYLSDQMDKVVQLVKRFKSTADMAANDDPIHIGLLRAGIRIILEVGAGAYGCPRIQADCAGIVCPFR